MIEVWPHSNIREVKVTSPDYAQCDEDKGKRLNLVPFPVSLTRLTTREPFLPTYIYYVPI